MRPGFGLWNFRRPDLEVAGRRVELENHEIETRETDR